MPGRDRDDGEKDWIEVRRFNDALAAETAQLFLTDHDVPARVLGGTMNALPSMGLTDVRILVQKDNLERAIEALAAFDGAHSSEHPFRDGAPVPYEKPVERKRGAFGLMLAILVPLGAGHFYARHGAAGAVLAAGIVGCFLGAFVQPALLTASAILVVVDAVSAPYAVRRFNEQRIPSEGRQRGAAVIAVAVAMAAALAIAR